MLYLIVFAGTVLCMFGYFKIASQFGIIDKPNNRSSHKKVTIRGGGIVFPVALLLYAVLFYNVPASLLAGILLISGISFCDDIRSLPRGIRFLVHMLAVSALLWSVNAFALWPFWVILLSFVLIAGTINAYNFMDGINGITGLYSLVILMSLWFRNTGGSNPFVDEAFILCPIVACLVFLFFNFRKKARCFAGDVGSVGIGFWIISLLLMLIVESGSLKYILFLSVYGVDAVLTILHRLILKQNIFEAHRLHFYQILANDRKIPHLWVSAGYALLQLLINLFVIYTNMSLLNLGLAILLPLAVVYIVLKPRLMSRGELVNN